MSGINLEKSQNYNEPGRTLQESSLVEIVARLPRMAAGISRLF
ncbi:hypothetical protein T11_9097 [Trichinella zimbabwensis]|uniref:Uncharacterized protein n=1 Tax=Trichinella zimbabwensis TaxID=268475 RepID=A0A0V1GRF9_9BILA|nr:hypothetical protein T11_9097 [Trichinella zimbabwensis]